MRITEYERTLARELGEAFGLDEQARHVLAVTLWSHRQLAADEAQKPGRCPVTTHINGDVARCEREEGHDDTGHAFTLSAGTHSVGLPSDFPRTIGFPSDGLCNAPCPAVPGTECYKGLGHLGKHSTGAYGWPRDVPDVPTKVLCPTIRVIDGKEFPCQLDNKHAGRYHFSGPIKWADDAEATCDCDLTEFGSHQDDCPFRKVRYAAEPS